MLSCRHSNLVHFLSGPAGRSTASDSISSAAGIRQGKKFQNLMGVWPGYIPSFPLSYPPVFSAVQSTEDRISHNKTLAAQLYEESGTLPAQRRRNFVIYYAYYQPEAYIPQRENYIGRTASRKENDDLDGAPSLAIHPGSRKRRAAGGVGELQLRPRLSFWLSQLAWLAEQQGPSKTDRDECAEAVDLSTAATTSTLQARPLRVRGDVGERTLP